MAGSTGRGISGIRVYMGVRSAKPRFWRMRCCGMASQAVLLTCTGSPVVRAVAVCAECHAIYPDCSCLGMGSVSSRITPARRVTGWPLSMAQYSVSIGTETADLADATLQISSMTFRAFVWSRQVYCRVVPAGVGNNPAGRMLAGFIENKSFVIIIAASPYAYEHEQNYAAF